MNSRKRYKKGRSYSAAWVYAYTDIHQWESITETFYLKDMQNSKLLNFSTVPWLLKDPRPHQVRQTQDESYINHDSFYCTVWAEFMFMSHRPMLCASEIGNIMEGSTIDIFHFCINVPGCTLCSRLFFFLPHTLFISALWTQCHNAIMLEWFYSIKQERMREE